MCGYTRKLDLNEEPGSWVNLTLKKNEVLSHLRKFSLHIIQKRHISTESVAGSCKMSDK